MEKVKKALRRNKLRALVVRRRVVEPREHAGPVNQAAGHLSNQGLTIHPSIFPLSGP